MEQKQVDILITKFRERYGQIDVRVRAPGRINILGEHTDYNEGFVLPASIDKEVQLAIRKNGNSECHLSAIDLDDEYSFSLEEELKPTTKGWANFIIGVVAGLKDRRKAIEGFDLAFTSDIPQGSGMSSSAAIESAVGMALNHLFSLEVNRKDLAKIGQSAEHNYVGVKCGIMDQFASLLGKEDHLIRLDCRDLNYDYIKAELPGHSLLLLDTGVKHSLADSEYNKRREDCEKGVNAAKNLYPMTVSLRDLSTGQLEKLSKIWDDQTYARCSYVIEENERVGEICEAISSGNMELAGQIMNRTHEGLSLSYEVSCTELDLLAGYAKEDPRVKGARMMGGGFGGCTINLVESAHVEDFIKSCEQKYRDETGQELKAYEVRISDGCGVIHDTV